MLLTEIDIAPGLETQVAVTPVLYSTSNEAQTRFTPEERGCYFDHELPLTYLPTKWYRYDINNCLFEAAYEKGNEKNQDLLLRLGWIICSFYVRKEVLIVN